jgi:hypothetical protein
MADLVPAHLKCRLSDHELLDVIVSHASIAAAKKDEEGKLASVRHGTQGKRVRQRKR